MLKDFEGCGIEVKLIHKNELVTLTVALAKCKKSFLNVDFVIGEDEALVKVVKPELIWIDGNGRYTSGSFYSGGYSGTGKDLRELQNLVEDEVEVLETDPIEALKKFQAFKEKQKKARQVKAQAKKLAQEKAVKEINALPESFPVESKDPAITAKVFRKEAFLTKDYGDVIHCEIIAQLNGEDILFLSEFFTDKGNLRKKLIDRTFTSSKILGGEALYDVIKGLKAKVDEVRTKINEIAKQ